LSLCFVCPVANKLALTESPVRPHRSLKMDRWKTKELKQMELGGNKNAKAFYEENFMYKDGKPDHEAPLHSRYKLELAAKAEAAIREEIQARSKL